MEIFTLVPLIIMVTVGFWRRNPAVLILAGAVAGFDGFYWYDTYTTPRGMTEGISLVAFGLVCWGTAYRYMFFREGE